MAKVTKEEISIFLASSVELRKDREKFADFVGNLQKHYSKRGLGFQLEKWEYLDSAYNGRPKQDEYNDVIKKCDVFVALFHNKAGKYTLQEFDIAVQECQTRQLPLFIYFREQTFFDKLKNGTEGLKPITDRIANLQHFWGSYGTSDKLHLDFVLWLDSYIFDGKSPIKVENGHVMLEDMKVAEMSGMSFAINNKEYQYLEVTLQKLDEDIEQIRENIKKYPDDSGFPASLSKKVMERDKIQKKLEVQQEAFLGTARHIAELKKQQVSKKLQKAIDAFEAGQLNEANKLLEELEHEGECLMEEIESKHEQIHKHIDALLLQTQVVMSDVGIPIGQRITRVAEIYSKANDWATRSAYDKEKYVKLLSDYGRFLEKYGNYKGSEQVYLRLITLSEELYGKNDLNTAASYSNISWVYCNQGKYDKALKSQFKALDIRRKIMGADHSVTAQSYNNIGFVYKSQGDFNKALEYYGKAMIILEKSLGADHLDIAMTINNIGRIYDEIGNYSKALEYLERACVIREMVLDTEHIDTAQSYNNIGLVYWHQGNYDKALEYHLKAMKIKENLLGSDHPDTATSYNNIGLVYKSQNDYDTALEFHFKALEIDEKYLGTDHPNTAIDYNNIGGIYDDLGDYDKALEYYFKALVIDEKILGTDHPNTAQTYNNIGLVYFKKGEYNKALEYHFKLLAVQKKVYGMGKPSTFNIISSIYFVLGDYDKVLEYYKKAEEIKSR